MNNINNVNNMNNMSNMNIDSNIKSLTKKRKRHLHFSYPDFCSFDYVF